MLSRRALTDLLLATVKAKTNYPVGDADHPDPPYGWTAQSGAPGSSFKPYSILNPQSSGTAQGPFSDTHADWRLTYTLSSYGTNRTQCEWINDLARSALYELKKETFDGVDGTYQIMQVRTENIGGIVRSDVVEPATFGQTDTYVVWITKEIE
mgnify:CR=1 FL=1